MFSLLDLGFVLCSSDLDVLRTQRVMGFLSYPQINAVRKSGHVVVFLLYLSATERKLRNQYCVYRQTQTLDPWLLNYIMDQS